METQRFRTALRLGITTFAAFVLLSTGAQASCKQGFCVKGHDEGNEHFVNFTTTWTNISHFNWINPFNHEQYELGANERQFSFIKGPSGTIEHYALQACGGGGFMQGSSCTTWAYFTYTAP